MLCALRITAAKPLFLSILIVSGKFLILLVKELRSTEALLDIDGQEDMKRIYGIFCNPRGETASKHKDGDSWRDLIINPLQWWDYRGHKSNGLVKEKFPDFKRKATGESLWINGAPEWVLAGLGKVEFDVKPIYAKTQPAGPWTDERIRNEKGDGSWKNLVENPDKWWDNQSNKKNPKAPDFKHKESGEVLWLNRSPDWALSKLPPL